MINAEIITIGDELLIGQVIDTNSAWIAIELNKIGFDVRYKTTVGDDEKDILDAFERAFSRASVILVTGGIGPTKDDITKNTLCKFFNTRLIFDNQTLETVKEVVENIGKTVNELTYAQAYVPENALIIQNKAGTAPVTWFEKNKKVLVSMPGVPFEMKWIMKNEIIPRLQNFYPTSDTIMHATFWVKNYSESQLALHISDWESQLPDFVKLAYLPNYGLIRLRLTGKYSDKDLLEVEMQKQRRTLLELLDENILSEEDASVEYILHNLLQKRNLTLGLAESCTGGKIASLLTAMPGSSHYLKGGLVAYSNEVKSEILGVRTVDIEEQGVVSRIVVEQMAQGVREIFCSDCAIATSGIAGPGGGTPEKPVGTVWIAVAYKDKIMSQKYLFSKNREANILRASYTGMMMLIQLIRENSIHF